MLDAVFYDRKNEREVKSSELMGSKVVYGVRTVDADDLECDHCHGARNILIGEVGYKAKGEDVKKFPNWAYSNWDFYCMMTDLVFLRFDDMDQAAIDEASKKEIKELRDEIMATESNLEWYQEEFNKRKEDESSS